MNGCEVCEYNTVISPILQRKERGHMKFTQLNHKHLIIFMPSVIIYPILIIIGFVFQLLLQGPSRMIVDMIVGIISGFCLITFSTFLPLMFGIGMMVRIMIGGYWVCVVLMILYILAGVSIGFVF